MTSRRQATTIGLSKKRRSFVRSFVRGIKVTGDEVVLSCVPPIGQDEVKEESLRVLPTVRYGGQ